MPPTLTDLPPPPPGRQGWPWTTTPTAILATPAGPLPRISIVTPSFNQGVFIEETIRSVLLQGYPNLEYIVIDGGSTDETLAVLEKYSPWITYWVSEKDRGQSHAINKGLVRASGEWFNWLNSDDCLAPGALFALASAAQIRPGIVAVSGVTANLRDGSVFSRYSAQVPSKWPDTLFALRVNQPGSLLHLPSLRSCGDIREDLRLVMDLDAWLRLARRHGPDAFAQIDAEVACYRYHQESKTCAGVDVFALEEFALLADLAECAPGLQHPEGLRRLRSQCSAENRPAEGLPLDTLATERSWLDRLLVIDSLLFRALRHTLPRDTSHLPAFVQLLDELAPALSRHHDSASVDGLLARALVHAMQTEGSIQPSAALRALRFSPGVTTFRDILRLALNR